MENKKLKDIVIESLQLRGYSLTEAEMFISQLSINNEDNVIEVLPGSGIFCPEVRMRECFANTKATIDERTRLWHVWMNRCEDLANYVQDALEPFRKKIEEINVYKKQEKENN